MLYQFKANNLKPKKMTTQTTSNKVAEFLASAKVKAAKKAKEMAYLELSVWNDKHEFELENQFGYSKDDIRNRKNNLILQVETINNKVCS